MPENSFVPLPGSERTPLAGAEETVQQLDDSQRIEVTLITRRRADLPAEYVTGPATLTRDQLAAQHGTDPADLALIRDVLGRFGIEVTGADAGARRVTVAGPISAFSAAFGASLRLVNTPHPARSGGAVQHRYRVGGLQVPAELDGVVVAVLGLDDRPQASPQLRRAPGIAAAAAGVAGPTS
jgi:kumamolisin